MPTMRVFNETGFAFARIDDPVIPPERSLTFILKATFTLKLNSPCVPAKKQRPLSPDSTYMDELGRSLAWPSDREPFKPHTDFLILGAFHQPGGAKAPEGRAGFTFGPLKKELAFFGPRVATQRADGLWEVSEPEPVASVPLRWELSAGGLSDKRNPFGMGIDAETGPDGRKRISLPQIEDPNALLHFPGGHLPRNRPPPANFAPLSPFFAERRRKLGTRDRRWTLFRAPLPPKDYDPSHRNAAPADQQAGNSPRGEETLVLRNLHPKLPELTTQLPGLRARLAILRNTDPLGEAEEVAMRLDTVVVLPDEDQLVLIWRGVVPCRTRNPEAELLGVECAVEALDAKQEEPAIAARLRRRFQDEADETRKKQEAATAAAVAEMRKLLSKAKLPADLEKLVKTEDNPQVLHDALDKYLDALIAELKQKYPQIDTDA